MLLNKMYIKHEVLQFIARHLILHGSFVKDVGLLEGKMGVAIFFYHYAAYINKRLYNDFAGELIDEIYNEIGLNNSFDFKGGFTGIAWALLYLIRNKFVDADPNEILEDLDKKILEWDVRYITDISLETGLVGLAHYVIYRYSNKDDKNCSIPYNYISELATSIKLKINEKNLNYHVIDNLTIILSGKQISTIENPLYQFYRNNTFKEDSFSHIDYPLGISNNGLAGVGMNLMKIR